MQLSNLENICCLDLLKYLSSLSAEVRLVLSKRALRKKSFWMSLMSTEEHYELKTYVCCNNNDIIIISKLQNGKTI